MASLLSILLEFLRGLRLAKDHIKRFPRRWTSLLAYLIRKIGEWWPLRPRRPSKPGTVRNPKPAEPSFPRDRTGPSSVSGGSVYTGGIGGYVVAASTVPPSANYCQPLSHEHAEPQSHTAPPSPTPATPSVDPPCAPGPSMTNRTVGSSRANRSSGNLRVQDPKATSRQFGPGPGGSPSRGQSSRSPSQDPFLNIVQLDSLDTAPMGAHAHPPADWVNNPTIDPQGLTNLSSHTQGRPGRPAIHHPQIVVTDPEEPTATDTDTRLSLRIPPLERPEAAFQKSPMASSAISVSTAPAGRIFRLINSDEIPRYTKNVKISREDKPQLVSPLRTTFPHLLGPNAPDQASLVQDCEPWIPSTHPDGALYFYDPGRRLFTDTDMHNKKLKEEMEDLYSHLKKIERVKHFTIPSKEYDTVLEIVDKDDKIQWSYYYACHDTRCLFWLHTYDAKEAISEVYGVESPAHLRHRLESLYWKHWNLFPVVFKSRRLPHSVYDELMGILAHGCIDVMTSRSSTLPYDDDQMQKMITLVQKAKEASSVGSIGDVKGVSDAGGMHNYTAATTRLLSFFAHWRFLYFHGQRHARLICDQTAYDTPKRKRLALVTLLSMLLFFAPEAHLMEMDKLWTDEVIIERTWKDFMTNLSSEWNDIILWSTVMLAVDVGFLAIPGVVPYSLQSGGMTITPQMTILVSLSEATTIISLGASAGSTIISLLLKRHNRTKQELDPAAACQYLSQASRTYFGLELMAIAFSLPWALLMWSMLMFHVALFCYCWSIPKHESRIVIASVTGVLLVFLGACFWTFWKSSDTRTVWVDGLPSPIVRALRALRLSRLHDAAVSFYKRFHSNRRDGVVAGEA